jgi:predicted  nucleic acid-binding Zn-ribbon protein
MASLDQLLTVQEHDTTSDQLHHRRDTLAERTELADRRRELVQVEADLVDTQNQRDEVARAQKRLEDEVATVEDKVKAVHDKLYGGTVTSPRELQAFQDDETALKRHQSAVEDKVIEQMELAVPLDERLAALVARAEQLEAEIEQTVAALLAAEEQIDLELMVVADERAAAAEGLDADLLSRYETLRHELGGIAVARLVGTNCGGCHLTLSAVELDRIRHQPPGEAVQCEECGRLLVH